MPREPYRDRQRYDRDDRERSDGGSHRRERDRDRLPYEEDREERISSRAGGSSSRGDVRRTASSSKKDSRDALSPQPRRRRSSRSPDFERDRARERQAYDRRHDTSKNRNGSKTRDIQEGGEGDQLRGNNEPVFEASGLLAKESNNKNGVALKYSEPAEARKPKKKWRLYVFKDGKEIDVLHISRQSCYLMGRDRAVADIPIDHTSISKQHAVIQFRKIRERNEFGDEKQSIKPFLIDLDSANGCTVNDIEVPSSRYYEMRNGDTLKLGGSLREYVLLAEE